MTGHTRTHPDHLDETAANMHHAAGEVEAAAGEFDGKMAGANYGGGTTAELIHGVVTGVGTAVGGSPEGAGGKVAKHKHDYADNITQHAANARENERNTAQEIDDIRTGKTPVFYVDDHGNVHKLENGKLTPVTGPTGTSLDAVISGGKMKDPTPAEKKALSAAKPAQAKAGNEPPDVVHSQRITGPTALSVAVEETRRANNGGDGDYSKKNNYASVRYVGEDGNPVILVGRSSQLRSHSERSIGYPFAHAGLTDGIQQLYTERRPCQAGSQCERWLHMYVDDGTRNPPLEVTHGVQYDNSVFPVATRNEPHSRYIDQLRANHHHGIFSGTAGSQNFD